MSPHRPLNTVKLNLAAKAARAGSSVGNTKDLLIWLNDLLGLEIKAAESRDEACGDLRGFGDGAFACGALDAVTGCGVRMGRVRFGASEAPERLGNWRLFQEALDKAGVRKEINVERLAKGMATDCLDLLKWLRALHDGEEYDGYGRRRVKRKAPGAPKRRPPPVKAARVSDDEESAAHDPSLTARSRKRIMMEEKKAKMKAKREASEERAKQNFKSKHPEKVEEVRIEMGESFRMRKEARERRERKEKRRKAREDGDSRASVEGEVSASSQDSDAVRREKLRQIARRNKSFVFHISFFLFSKNDCLWDQGYKAIARSSRDFVTLLAHNQINKR